MWRSVTVQNHTFMKGQQRLEVQSPAPGVQRWLGSPAPSPVGRPI